jgi:hypothetical protein
VGVGAAPPSWSDPGEIDDRTIYRRADTIPRRPGAARPVQAEIVDGAPVYRIYRPRPAFDGPAAYDGPVYDGTVYDRTGGGRAD